MSDKIKCDQQAWFRYTWPGRDESFVCVEHAIKLKHVSNAMGLQLQFIPLSSEQQIGKVCTQKVNQKVKEKST